VDPDHDDKEALEAAVGASDVVEIIVGQPYGADDVVEAVHVTDILECAGATVTAVDSAEDALDILQRERPNVLLSDLSMPEGKDGYWLIGQVRALPPERGGTTPAAALTGYTGPEHRASVLRAGFQYHVEMPVGILELTGVVAILALKE